MRCLVRDGIPEEDVRTFAGRDAEGCPGAVVAEGQQSPAGAASSSPGSLVTADQLGHGPDDEPLAWFIEYAVAGEVEGAELAGGRSPRAQPSLGITESGRRGRGAQTAAIGSSEDSTPTGRRHGPSLPPAAQPANRHTIRGMSGRGARKPCRFSSDRLYLKRLHRPPYSWGESPSSQRQDHGLHRGA